MKPASALFFASGNVACFNERGEQIPELQESYLMLWCKHAESLGYNVDGLAVELPAGKATIFRTDCGLNWRIP